MILVFAWPRTDHKGHTIGGGDSPKHSRMAADQGVSSMVQACRTVLGKHFLESNLAL